MSQLHPKPALNTTVVVCTRRRPRDLELCLQSIRQLCYPNFEILVVENGPPDGDTRDLALEAGARYLNSPVVGLSRARNDAILKCNTDLIAYTDDDARPRKDWLTNIAREFREPDIMAVAGEMLPLTDDRVPQPAREINYEDQRSLIVDRNTPNWFSITNFGGIGDGCNMCFRRKAFAAFPGFDERLGRGAILNSAEEHFCFFQLVLLGYRCVHTPYALVQHPRPLQPDEVYRFHRTNLVNAVAYAYLLWNEFPVARGMLLRHLVRRTLRKQRHARQLFEAPALSFPEKLDVLAEGRQLFDQLPPPIRRTALLI